MKQKKTTYINHLTTGFYQNQTSSLNYMGNTAVVNQSKSQGILGRIGTGLVGGVSTLSDGISSIVATKKSYDNEADAIQAEKATGIEAISSHSSTVITVVCCVVLAVVVAIIYTKKKGA